MTCQLSRSLGTWDALQCAALIEHSANIWDIFSAATGGPENTDAGERY
jgi:hypothetical protein